MAVTLLLLTTLVFRGGAHLGAAPAATPRLDWRFDSTVNATARIGNTLYVGGQFTAAAPSAGGALAPPAALAAFDLTSGALVPGAPAVTGAGAGVGVYWLATTGSTLFLTGRFDAVNGQPRHDIAAVDVSSGTVLAWPAANAIPPNPQPIARLQFVSGPWVYAYLSSDPAAPLQRIDASTGVVDPTWRAQVPPNGALNVAPSGGALLAVQKFDTGAIGPAPARAGTLDPVTGSFSERSRFTVEAQRVEFAADGDTLYFVDPPWDVATGRQGALRAIDVNSGRPVSVPVVVGELAGVAVADGRLFPFGAAFTVGGAPQSWLAEVARPGTPTGWPASPSGPGRNWSLSVHGDRLVQVAFDGVTRVRAFELSGPAAPANLRAQTSGSNTVFSWDPAAVPPAGGYVIEGGFASGQTAAALPVGNATSVALPMPAGPIFIRVRAAGSSEVSNEIIAGCVAPPSPPTALTTTLSGTNLTLSWTPPTGAVTNYTLLAGTASGLSNVATLPLGAQTSVSGQVPGGTFYARVTAFNACGTSGPSGEVFFTIGAADPLPAAPTNLTSNVSGSTLSLSWTAPSGPVTGYVLEAGSAPGLANIGAATIGAVTSFVIPGVPPGTYYVRVRAVTTAGTGAPSADVTVGVP